MEFRRQTWLHCATRHEAEQEAHNLQYGAGMQSILYGLRKAAVPMRVSTPAAHAEADADKTEAGS